MIVAANNIGGFVENLIPVGHVKVNLNVSGTEVSFYMPSDEVEAYAKNIEDDEQIKFVSSEPVKRFIEVK